MSLHVPTDIKIGESTPECKVLSIYCKIEKDETIDFYYQISSDIIVLTNKRFIKVNNGKIINSVYLANLTKIRHNEDHTFIDPDEIETLDKNDNNETFVIGNSSVGKFLTNMIQVHINNQSDDEE